MLRLPSLFTAARAGRFDVGRFGAARLGGFAGSFAPPIAVDLGSTQTKIMVQEHVVFHEPTCIALHQHTGSVMAIGQQALELLGKTPPQVKVVFPVRFGQVQDVLATQLFLRFCLDRVTRELPGQNKVVQHVLRPSVILSMPWGTTTAEQHVLQKLIREVGYPRVQLRAQLTSAYHHLEAQRKVARIFALVDIGAMKTEMAFFAQGEVVVARTVRLGGDNFTRAIKDLVQKKMQCEIGWQTAEKLKQHLGIDATVFNPDFLGMETPQLERRMVVRGRDILTSLPASVQVTASDVAEVYQPLCADLAQHITDLYQDAAPEVMAEGLDQGVMLTGGGSLLIGLAQILESRLRSPIHVSATALLDVVKGLE